MQLEANTSCENSYLSKDGLLTDNPADPNPGGGGGTLNIYWWGCAAAHPKRGVLGTARVEKGGLRHGHESKKGVLRTVLVKKAILVTDGAQKGVFEFIY